MTLETKPDLEKLRKTLETFPAVRSAGLSTDATSLQIWIPVVYEKQLVEDIQNAVPEIKVSPGQGGFAGGEKEYTEFYRRAPSVTRCFVESQMKKADTLPGSMTVADLIAKLNDIPNKHLMITVGGPDGELIYRGLKLEEIFAEKDVLGEDGLEKLDEKSLEYAQGEITRAVYIGN